MKANKPLLIIALVLFFIVNMAGFALKKVLDEWGYDEFEVSGWPLYKALRNEIHYIKGIYFRKTIQE